MCRLATKKRILVLGGGFPGVATARHLESFFRRRSDVDIVLVSRDNFVLMTPLSAADAWLESAAAHDD